MKIGLHLYNEIKNIEDNWYIQLKWKRQNQTNYFLSNNTYKNSMVFDNEKYIIIIPVTFSNEINKGAFGYIMDSFYSNSSEHGPIFGEIINRFQILDACKH